MHISLHSTIQHLFRVLKFSRMISGPFPCRSVYVKFVSWWVLFCLPCVFHFHSRWYKFGKPKAGIICKTKLHLNYKNFNFGLTMEDLELNARSKWKTKIWPLLENSDFFILSSVRYAIQIMPLLEWMLSMICMSWKTHRITQLTSLTRWRTKTMGAGKRKITAPFVVQKSAVINSFRPPWMISHSNLCIMKIIFPSDEFKNWSPDLIKLFSWLGILFKFLSPFLGEISHLSIAHRQRRCQL